LIAVIASGAKQSSEQVEIWIASLPRLLAMTTFGIPTKRSILIAGHQTSISLEPMFWRALEAEARARGCPVNALVSEIDEARLDSRPTPNLTSAIRQWLFAHASRPSG
jgi:predicted DNA-binding ribbon-helix-helix protein